MMKMKYPNNLKQIREVKKMTQEEFAVFLGYSVSGYRKIENGSRGFKPHKAMKAAEILNCSLNDIFLPSNLPKCTLDECLPSK
jgi:transcriptional regulator with XRE-family HTH domain